MPSFFLAYKYVISNISGTWIKWNKTNKKISGPFEKKIVSVNLVVS